METMDEMECAECGRLRAVYRSVTRHELDLKVLCDQAAIRNDRDLLDELQARVAAAGLARASASQRIVDHEYSPHATRIAAAR